MFTFKMKNHIEIDENYQGINLTEFSFDVDNKINNDVILETFIKSKHFSFESLRDVVKREPEKDYLGCAFNIEKVYISDFRKYSNKEVYEFLLNFANDTDWEDDKADFVNLLNKYFELLKQLGNIDFYVLSKDWFLKDKEKLKEPENIAYTYYFFIISIDRKLNQLVITEWTYD